MFINEAANLCGLTKKAVEYYIGQGLISPAVLENGYRDFSKQDIKDLKQIALYRRLGLRISEIKRVLADSDEIKYILYKRKLELEEEKEKQNILQKLCDGEHVEDLEQEINEINSGSIIIKKLIDLFPSYYGKFISIHFSGYLTGKIETKEQMEAFQEIIEFFDNVPDFEIPEDLQEYLDKCLEEYSGEEGAERIRKVIQAKDKGLENIDEFIENNKEILKRYNEYRHTDEFRNSSANRLMELMKKVCSSNGYYDKFIPAMRRLSPLYNEYYERMTRANEQVLKSFPEFSE